MERNINKDRLYSLIRDRRLATGTITGGVLGAATGAFATYKFNKVGIQEFKRLEEEFNASLDPHQVKLSDEIESIQEHLEELDNNITGGIIGAISKVSILLIMRKEKIHLSNIIKEFNRSLSKEQIKLRNDLSKVSNKNGWKFSLGVTAGTVLGALAGNYLGGKYDDRNKNYSHEDVTYSILDKARNYKIKMKE